MRDAIEAFRAAIVDSLGYGPAEIEPGRLQRFATSERRGDDAGWCKLFADLRGGVFGCYRQGMNETWCGVDRTALTREQRVQLARQIAAASAEREAEQRAAWARNARRLAGVWAGCQPLTDGDPVTRYLRRRLMVNVLPPAACLRFHHALPCWHDGDELGVFPAMVAPVVSPDGRTVALHRTYLTTDGRKADVPSPKKLTGTAGPLTGACIPLCRPVSGRLGIAEGIETASAATCGSGVPTVAAYCAGALAGWQWATGVRQLVVFADADRAGREAAQALCARASSAGLHCSVMTPTAEGADWCDVWAARDAVLVGDGGFA